MQTTSEAYKTKIKEPSREFKCKITIGTKIFTNDDIVDIILDSPQPSEGFSIGNTPSQTLDLTLLKKEDTIYSANQVKIEIGINTGSTIEYLVLGYFNIDDIEKTDYTTKITAFDNMIKFEAPFFSNIAYPATLQAVVNELAAKTGVQFTGSLPSYTLSKLEGFTCREILGYVASLCGGNAVITRDGKFTIVVPQDINYSIGTDNYFDYKREEVKYKISKVSCKAGDTELIKGTLGADSMELTFENPWVTDSILTDIYNKLNGFEYLGYTMKWQGDLSLDIGDIITCTDIKGVVRKLPILSQKLTYNGGLTSEIGAKGETKNKNSYNSKGENTKKLERVITELAIVNKALIDVAYIGDLTAGNIKFDTASGGTLDLQSLLANFISGDNGQFIHLTGSNVVIDNAVIKDAMIDTISAGKISAGTMSTNKFTISSDSGNLVIADNTIQIRDGTRVRVQIGKDASNDYSLYVWDNTGKLMFDALGLKADGIKDKIIRNDMVSDSANISGGKLDIDSVIVEVNTNGTETFKSSKVKIDSTGQTLDVAFTKVSEDVAGAVETANSAQSAVTIANEKIETLVKNTTIVKEDGTTVQLKDAYISTKQTVEGMTTTVSNLETTVNGENGLTSKMQIVEQKVTATGITTTISEAINAGTNSITTTQLIMDKTGFTVKNGSIKILNNAGSTVIKGDSNGNLVIGGSEGTSGAFIVKNTSNVEVARMDVNGLTVTKGNISGVTLNTSGDSTIGGNLTLSKQSGDTFTGGRLNFGASGKAYIATTLEQTSKVPQINYCVVQDSTYAGHIFKGGYVNIEKSLFVSGKSYLEGGAEITGVLTLNGQTVKAKPTAGDIVWNGGENIKAVASANSQEWSIDLPDTTYTGTYWHVWTGKGGKGSLLSVDNDGGWVRAFYGLYTPRIKDATGNNFYVGSDRSRIEGNNTGLRLYQSWIGSPDCGIQIDNSGAVQIRSNNTVKHAFYSGGTKTGGTMDIEGTTYGMSPTDSPQTLIEYIEFNVTIDGETEVFLDDIYSKMISKFTAIISNSDIKLKEKRSNSIILSGNGMTDIVFKGQRKGADQYFRIMNGFITQGYEKGEII